MQRHTKGDSSIALKCRRKKKSETLKSWSRFVYSKARQKKSNSRDRFLFIYPEQASTENRKDGKMCNNRIEFLSWV